MMSKDDIRQHLRFLVKLRDESKLAKEREALEERIKEMSYKLLL